VAGRVRVASLHDPRTHEKRDVDADGGIAGGCGWGSNEKHKARVGGVEAALGREIFNVTEGRTLVRWEGCQKVRGYRRWGPHGEVADGSIAAGFGVLFPRPVGVCKTRDELAKIELRRRLGRR